MNPPSKRADDGADERRHAHIDHRREELVSGKAAQQDQPAHGRHHRPAEPLQAAREDEHREAVRHAAEDGAGGEDDQRQHEDPARAEAIGEPSADGNEDRQGQHIGGHCQIHPQRRGAQAARHIRNGCRDDGRIQLFHQEGDGHDRRYDQPETGIALGREEGGVRRVVLGQGSLSPGQSAYRRSRTLFQQREAARRRWPGQARP